MVPFSSVVPRLERLARQISSKLGKKVAFAVHIEQGSIDRNMLQAIISPLEHIIRNAIDHGIESPEIRKEAGKPEQATLQISVSRKGASIWLDIRDDGQGIDVGKVREKARSSGLLGLEEDLSDEETIRLLFMPGFSTSTRVTGISGRGVGLDVVRSEIEYIGGTVDVSTSIGEGTGFHISLPLTSSLNRALLFEIQQTRYVVLMNSLDGVLTEKLASIHQRLKQQDRPGFEYADRSYEYLYLGKLINEGFSPRLDSIDSSIPLLLVSNEGRNYALHIDSIIESRDLVVKSFGQQFATMPGIAGGVIMPDGNVAIVLDLKSLVGLYGKKNRPAMEAPRTLTGRGDTEQQRKLVLVVDDSITVRKVTSGILKRHGMDVVTARNGLEALELLQKMPPDLILLDIEMPKMDGFEVAAWVRSQDEPVRSIPIIMITSRIGEKHRSRAEQIGVNEYLCKPFHEDNLLAHIRSY
jgi:chemosensory pili system protein ChpA (sensor histidine kinase/response regulator)